MKKIALHWKIIIGLVLGVVFGLALTQITGGKEFTISWIKPFGTIFVKLLKLIAIPLIMASLIKGIAELKDISKFKSMGLKTIGVYIFTTLVAISIGLFMVNLLKPGDGISQETISSLKENYVSNTNLQGKLSEASFRTSQGPLQPLVDIVPDNIVFAMSNNKSMLPGYFLYRFFRNFLIINR